MKVYISIDAEGITGIFKLNQVNPKGPDYGFLRRMMTSDVNAAIRGALAAGADEILVNDCHNYGDNLLLDELDPHAQLLSGMDKPLIMAEGLERGYDAALLIGYHCPKGAAGVISHTFFYGPVFDVKINGVSFGETDMVAHVAGYFGTPLVMVSGDDRLALRTEKMMPGTYAYTTKECIGNGSAICIHPDITSLEIERMAEESIRNRENIKPLKIDGLIHLELTLSAATQADLACSLPGFSHDEERENVVHYTSEDFLEVYKAFISALQMVSYFKDAI